MPSVLITQCLQHDFVGLVGPQDPVPNKLHVGRSEALRLLGPDPEAGPVAQLLHWARAQAPDELEILHVRDWHDARDPVQARHLSAFGPHCLAGTAGAELVAGIERDAGGRRNERFVNAVDLNDFEETDLRGILAQLATRGPLRVAVVGVWTEAKVSFLLYDLRTRGRVAELATSSALTASATRSQHFNALGQLERILGITVLDSVGDLASWLVPGGARPAQPVPTRAFSPKLRLPEGAPALDAEETDVLAFLYRDAADVTLTPLSGGFSGARVLRAESHDALGHAQAPSVAKLGPRSVIGKERVAFERVEEILGNHAPRVRGFVDLGERAGIKYSFAAMGAGAVRTLKGMVEKGAPLAEIERVVRTTFSEILAPFYDAAQYERLPLLAHYGFRAEFAPSVRKNVTALLGEAAAGAERLVIAGVEVPSPLPFYERFLAHALSSESEFHYVSYVHGDLNGVNVLVDSRDNVWLIDFFHTARGHVLKDLAKVENDLLYVFTHLANDDELREALLVTRALDAVEDLRMPLPETLPGLRTPALVRAWHLVRVLRELGADLVREDRSPAQLRVALLRYAAHTLSFEESTHLQKSWALAAAGGHAAAYERSVNAQRRLRVDFVDEGRTLGLTLCPGRRDRERVLEDDLDVLVELGVRRLVTLSTLEELEWAGVPDLGARATERGLGYRRLPIRDQGVPSVADALELVGWIEEARRAGERVVLHCMGGLGRSGLVAACVLVARGATPEAAIAAVRAARDPRAVETEAQERFVTTFARA